MQKIKAKLTQGDNIYFFKMFRFMRPYAVIYGISQLIYSAQGFAITYIFSIFVGNLMATIIAGDRAALISAGVTLGIMLGVFVGVLLVGIYVHILILGRVGLDLRRVLFRAFMRTGLEDAAHSGEGIAALNIDAEAAEGLFEDALMMLLMNIITIVGSTVVIFTMDWRIGIASLFVGVLSFFMQNRFTKPLAKLGKDTLEANARAVKATSNVFSGAMAIRAYNMQPQAFLTFDRENNRLRALGIKGGLITMGQTLFRTVEGWLTLLAVFGFGGWLAATGRIEFHTIAAIFVMSSALSSSIGSIGETIAGLQPPIAGAKRIFAVIERDEERIAEPSLDLSRNKNESVIARSPVSEYGLNSATRQSGEMRKSALLDCFGKDTLAMTGKSARDALAIENFTFRYLDGDSDVLKNINLRIEENQMVALIGGSGSGKSTLLRAIMGMYERDDINISIGGLHFSETPLNHWRKNFAYVDQSCKLFDMTIKENIAMGLGGNATDEQVIDAAKRAMAHDFIQELEQGYDTPCGEKGDSFSGGQKQRIAIARALIKNAPVLLFDEPTSALDKDAERHIMDTIEALRGRHTILYTTHNMDNIAAADRVIVMEDGCICSENKIQSVIT